MAGYNRYQYETTPRKLEPEYIPSKRKDNKNKEAIKKEIEKNAKNKAKAKKKEKKIKAKVVLYIFVAFSVLVAISYRNSLINESFSKKKTLQTELAALEKENEQMQVNLESKLNLNNIEKAAQERLGMQKLTNSQKVYINLPKQDYVEPASEEVVIEENQNLIQKIINSIKGN